MIVAVDFWCRARAEGFAFTDRQAVISITDPDQPLVAFRGAVSRVLRRQFLDLEEAVDHPKCPPNALFSDADAAAIIDAVRAWQQEAAPIQVAVHCTAGVSRSAAVALYVEAETGCEFARRAQADFANKRVVARLEAASGRAIGIPERWMPSSGIMGMQ